MPEEKNSNSALPAAERENCHEWADNQQTLADLLDITVKTIQRWLKKPGNPGADEQGRYKIAAWQSWAVQVGRKTRMPDKAQAELDGQLLKNERARLEIEKEQGRLCPYQEVAELLAMMTTAFTLRLAGSRHTLGPATSGGAAAENTKRIGAEHHNCLQELSIGDWAKKKEGPAGIFWSRVYAMLCDLLATASPGVGPSST